MTKVLVSHDFQLGLDTAAELLTRDPTNWRVHLVYSGVLRSIERYDAALAICNHWVEIDPLNPRARVERAIVLGHGLGRITAAMQDLEFVFEETGKRPLFVEVQMAIDSGDLAWLERIATQWRAQEGRVPSLLLAKLHHAKGDLEEAHTHARAALATGEDAWDALLLLNQPNKALEVAAKMLAAGSPRVLYATIEHEYPNRLAIPRLAEVPGLESVMEISRQDTDSLAKIVTPPAPRAHQ